MEIDQLTTEWQCGQDRNQEENLKLFKIEWDWKRSKPKPMGHSEDSFKRQVHGTKCLPETQQQNVVLVT